jgi:hypothetical protein
MVEPAAWRAFDCGYGPAFTGWLAEQHGPDRPAFRRAEDEVVVGLVDPRRRDFESLVVSYDPATVRLGHRTNLLRLKGLDDGALPAPAL